MYWQLRLDRARIDLAGGGIVARHDDVRSKWDGILRRRRARQSGHFRLYNSKQDGRYANGLNVVYHMQTWLNGCIEGGRRLQSIHEMEA